MTRRATRWAALLPAFLGCVGCASVATRPASSSAMQQAEWLDASRGRRVPVVIYGADGRRRPLAIISNGYGGKNTAYRFVADTLVGRGYVVASIQQDLPGDPPMATEGNLAVLRRPAWQVGANTIAYVMSRMVELGHARGGPVLLVGHSNGGDISMLFATEHPAAVSMVFSLDNRRMPMPRVSHPRICSARSSDFPADPGVLPTAAEQRRLGMRISQIPDLKHNDMWDGASPEQRAAMLRLLASCLR